MSDTLALTQQLIALPSVTPVDHGCQQLIALLAAKTAANSPSLPEFSIAAEFG
jgi:hypothetical protein